MLKCVFHYLIFKHIGMFCNNTSVVVWVYKGNTSTLIATACLLRFISLRHQASKASSLLPLHIVVENNAIADILSQAFKNGEFFHAHAKLVNYFNTNISLLQNLSWEEFKVPKKLTSCVISCLRGEKLHMESLLKIPILGGNTGDIGQNNSDPSKSNPTWKTSLPANEQLSSQVFPQWCGMGLKVSEIKSVFKRP